MKYFLDTEFIEGTQKVFSFFSKIETKPTIDLISIGIVSEDNREYYAISKDFNLKEAWNRFQLKKETIIHKGKNNGKYSEEREVKEYWIRNNVLKPIFDEFYIKVFNTDMPTFNYQSFKYLINKIGKSNKEIAKEVIEFAQGDPVERTNPEFYTYYGAYDWVVFCWLFGKMIDLPRGFPMFSKDLKVMLNDKIKKLSLNFWKTWIHQYDKLLSFDDKLQFIKVSLDYPSQNNLHNALDDAKWNLKLYNFIKNHLNE